jgi:hypothetical protein
MDDRISAFRSRLRDLGKQKRAPSSFRDKVAIFTGITALVISGISTYFSLIRLRDDFRVVISGTIEQTRIERIQEAFQLGLDAEFSIAFINAGTRMIDISGVGLVAGTWRQEEADNECKKDSVDLGYKLEPFILKPGEILRKELKSAVAKRSAVPLFKDMLYSSTKAMPICVKFNFLTLNWIDYEKTVPVLNVVLNMASPQEPATLTFRLLGVSNKPVVLFERWETIFSQ